MVHITSKINNNSAWCSVKEEASLLSTKVNDSHPVRLAQWNKRIAELQEFLIEYQRPPHAKEGQLGHWVNQVQNEYKKAVNKDSLNQARLKELEALPSWTWVNYDKTSVQRHVTEITDWFNNHPDRYSITEADTDFSFNAYFWIEIRRGDYRKGKLNSDEIALIESIPNWRWDGWGMLKRSKFEYELLNLFQQHTRAKVTYGSAKGISKVHQCDIVIPVEKLIIEYDGYYYHKSKQNQDAVKTEDLMKAGWKVLRIRELGLAKITENDVIYDPTVSFSNTYGELLAWAAKNGCFILSGKELALHQEKVSKQTWEEKGGYWAEGFMKLKEHLNLHNSYPPTNLVDEDGFALGNWLANQKRQYARGSLTPTREQQLSNLPNWQWSKQISKLEWADAYQKLKTFFDQNSKFPSRSYRDSDDGYNLELWIRLQRKRYHNKKIKQDEIKLLEAFPGWS